MLISPIFTGGSVRFVQNALTSSFVWIAYKLRASSMVIPHLILPQPSTSLSFSFSGSDVWAHAIQAIRDHQLDMLHFSRIPPRA